MSYELDRAKRAQVEKPGLGPDVDRVTAQISQNFLGEDVLSVQVVIDDKLAFGGRSKRVGTRLQRLETELRQRAANAGIPLFTSISFLARSEDRRTAKMDRRGVKIAL